MRLALAIVAALANAAGPWLCCCAMAVMMRQPKAATAETQTAIPKCSHCKDESTEKQKSSPATPKKDKSCPCQEHLASDLTTLQPATETATAAVSDAISHDFNLPAGSVDILSMPPIGPSQVSDGPFMTTETRLHVHHVLRC